MKAAAAPKAGNWLFSVHTHCVSSMWVVNRWLSDPSGGGSETGIDDI